MTEVTEVTGHGRLEEFRREIPGAVARVAEFVVDNPGQVALVVAGTVVLAAAARNIVRPRTVVELLALQAVLTAATPLAIHAAMQRGWLNPRIRDARGLLVPAFEKED